MGTYILPWRPFKVEGETVGFDVEEKTTVVVKMWGEHSIILGFIVPNDSEQVTWWW